MLAIRDAMAAWRSGTDTTSRTENASGGAFSKYFERAREERENGRGGIESVMSMFASQFAGVNFRAGEVAEGVEAAQADIEKVSGDQVTLEPALAERISGNEQLGQKIRDIISGLLDDGNQHLMNVEGASVQRSVTITVTTVRYGEFHRSDETGETLASADLQTELQDRLAEILKKFFGAPDAEETEEGEQAAATETEAAKETETTATDRLSQYFTGSWSLQFHFSQTLIGGMNNGASNNAAASWMQESFSFAAFGAGGFSGSNSGLSSLLGGGKSSSSSSASGLFAGLDLTEFLNSALLGTNFNTNGMRVNDSGLLFGMGRTSDRIADLLERLAADKAAQTATPKAPETEAAPEVEAEAAQAVA